jgi:epoxyqueuosine reductase
MTPSETLDPKALRQSLEMRARALGFGALGISAVKLADDERYLERWLAAGRHGQMHYMQRHGRKRTRPEELLPGTISIISVRMDYWPAEAADAEQVLKDPEAAYLSRYALGRDYHKVLRQGLKALAEYLESCVPGHSFRAFVDSAPVLEKALARDAGLGWIGKHTNLIARDAGSYFFLGELYTDLQLPPDAAASAHCGSCTACLSACPTAAITAPYELDARRCISYLTIELKGSIPEEFRAAMGNRIYGCDDCQLVCPWNRYARAAAHPDLKTRHALDAARLTELFGWSPQEFEARMAGSAIYRIGYEQWLRNLAVALGNAPASDAIRSALLARRADASELVREHVAWALARHGLA